MSSGDAEASIYAAAEPFWRTRENHVHVPESYALGKHLLASFPEADEQVVLPAILLHDVGYSEVPEDQQLSGLAGAPIGWEPEVTRRHEIAGARIAGEVLRRLDYDEERTARIEEIIDGHDSRTEAISLEDAIVKDADKLWRFTESGVRICSTWMSRTPAEFMDFVESRIDDWMLTEPGRRLAREAIARSRAAFSGADG